MFTNKYDIILLILLSVILLIHICFIINPYVGSYINKIGGTTALTISLICIGSLGILMGFLSSEINTITTNASNEFSVVSGEDISPPNTNMYNRYIPNDNQYTMSSNRPNSFNMMRDNDISIYGEGPEEIYASVK